MKPVVNPWQEELWVLALSSELHLLVKAMLFRGSAAACPVHPRDIFRVLVLANASSFAIAHNHPSGNCEPSPEDTKITHRLTALGEMMEIPLVDHLILGEGRYFSFADAKMLRDSARRPRRKRS